MNLPENFSLQATLAAQHDLETLCADRPLPAGELFPPNGYYGMGGIIKRYSGLSQEYRLRAILPHGVVFGEDYVWEAEIKANLPVVMCYPAYRQTAYRQKTDKSICLAASPYAYLVEIMASFPKPERKGTIFFPAHSTHHITTEMDYALLAELLRDLEAEYQPVTVCLYWRDVQLGKQDVFTQAGLPVVSAGHMHDPDFLIRLYHLFSLHRYASSNELGSHLFYSLISGCSFFMLSGIEVRKMANVDLLKRDTAPPSDERSAYLQKLFSSRYRHPTAEQMSVVQEYLGLAYKSSPNDLRRKLTWAQIEDVFGVFISDRSRIHIRLPTFWRRVHKKIRG